MPSLLIIIPLAAILILNLPVSKLMKRIAFPIAALLLLVQVSYVIFPAIGLKCFQNLVLSPYLTFNLFIDNISLVMLICIGIVSLAALFVGQYTINDENKRFNFINLLILSVTGMNGIVMVLDAFTLYVFLELTAVSSFIMIALNKEKDSLEGSFKYLIMSGIATAMMLSALALMILASGDTSFAAISAGLKISSSSNVIIFAICLFVSGLMIKGGVVPFHGWLPDAYSSAPQSVSVLLAGIVTKTTGIYTIIRLTIAVFGFSTTIKMILLITGTISILVGALAALGQSDFKRMLAYSSISQVGYIIVSLGAGTPLGIAGAIFHLFNHSIFKTQLFVNSAAIEAQLGTRDMDKMGGIASKMPVTGSSSVVAFLSTAGIPPLSGFWSKLIIIIALWTSNNRIFAVIAVLASLITLAYFLSMQRRVFFGKLREGLENLSEARTGLILPAIILALITIGVGIFFGYILNSFILPVQSIFG